jgi:hypothetical protein
MEWRSCWEFGWVSLPSSECVVGVVEGMNDVAFELRHLPTRLGTRGGNAALRCPSRLGGAARPGGGEAPGVTSPGGFGERSVDEDTRRLGPETKLPSVWLEKSENSLLLKSPGSVLVIVLSESLSFSIFISFRALRSDDDLWGVGSSFRRLHCMSLRTVAIILLASCITGEGSSSVSNECSSCVFAGNSDEAGMYALVAP